MKGFYANLIRGKKVALLAGPFRDEPTARKYLRAAANMAHQLDHWAWFDAHGTMMLERDELPIGKLNDRLDIDPADLIQTEEA
jgi:hypothetical protein